MLRVNMKYLIIIEIQNSRTVQLLVLKEYVNKLTMHAVSNKIVDTNLFDK
jgi:hypothetical protein